MQQLIGTENAIRSFVEGEHHPIFLIGVDGANRITLHVGSENDKGLINRFKQSLTDHGVKATVKVVRHSETHLGKMNNLTAFTKLFDHDWIAYDPTGVVRRTKAVTEATSKARTLFGRRLAGVHLDSSVRRVHVVLRREVIKNNGESPLLILRDAEAFIKHEITSYLAATSSRMLFTVTASFMAPKTSCVAVDKETLALARYFRFNRMLRKSTLPIAFATGLGLASTAFAGNSAVSQINGKIEGFAGDVDSGSSEAGAASIAFPVGDAYGVQLDGFVGDLSDLDTKGVAAHVFWRDSKTGLLGITGSYSDTEDIGMSRVGIEGEYYHNQFTVSAQAGHQSGDVDDAGYGGMDLRYYALDNLMIEAGGRIADSDTVAHLGIEYQAPLDALPGLSVFADLADGENGYDHAIVGLRYYFGSKKSLIKRHREDDPKNSVFDAVSSGFTAITKARAAQTCPSGWRWDSNYNQCVTGTGASG